MSRIIIRPERAEDFRKTETMVRRAFWNIHGPGCNEHFLVSIIRKSPDYLPEFSRVAEMDGEIVGAIFYTKAKVVNGAIATDIVTFGPLAVEPTLQSRGIGRMLLEATLPLAKEAGYPGVCIYGEPYYYPKRGFVTCDRFGITDPNGKNFDALMAYPLDSEAFSNVHGKLYESPSFEACEDGEALSEFEKNFPPYEKIKIKEGFLQIYERQFGKVLSEDNGGYTVAFWELKLAASLASDYSKTNERAPKAGDTVLFSFRRDGGVVIHTVVKPL